MKIRLMVALVGLAISFGLPSFAQQQKSLKELIVGTWLLGLQEGRLSIGLQAKK
jgi:hypothetical protein